ncbi:MAG: peptidylprolyl isomerase [Gammaproteobacteria bacterium]|nr:peptidylprolyl isomerase [Gammaproteobacteria bacterium]
MRRFTTLLAFFAPFIVHAADDNTRMLDRVVAIVNDDIITESELDAQLKVIKQQLADSKTQLPPANILRHQVLEREIVKQIQLQLAKATGIIVDDNALNNTLTTIASQNNMQVREFADSLEAQGYPFVQFREDIRNDMVMANLRQREVVNRIVISDQEVENFLATQSVQGNADDQYRLGHILISVREAASPADIKIAREKAESILEKLKKGADFRQTAVSYSDAPQALEGGDLGWRKAGELPTLFANRVVTMKINEVSELIRSASGFHIIKLLEKRAVAQNKVTQALVRHILIRPNELLSESDALIRIQQLKRRIDGGENFAELAKSNSDDRASASQGGDLGWKGPGDFVPQFENVMDKTAIGKISEPFQTQFGWHILQVMERRTMGNDEEYKLSKAKDLLRQRKLEELHETWLRQLRDEAYVDIKLEN